MAANKAVNKGKKYPIFIEPADKAETERYFGTPSGSGLVQTKKRVEVPFAYKEGYDLARMQQRALDKFIEEKSLKTEPDELK